MGNGPEDTSAGEASLRHRHLEPTDRLKKMEAYAEAAADPDFMADMDSVARDFYGAETDGLGAGGE